MDEPAFGVYEAVYEQLPKTADGEITCTVLTHVPRAFSSLTFAVSEFKKYFIGGWPSVDDIEEKWQRVDPISKINSQLSRNHVLTVLYMLHVEHHFPNEKPQSPENPRELFSDDRRRDNAHFGNWVACTCQRKSPVAKPCAVRWNFANGKHGLWRGSGLDTCLVARWCRAKEPQRTDLKQGKSAWKKNMKIFSEEP